jgi:hypothetical protein
MPSRAHVGGPPPAWQLSLRDALERPGLVVKDVRSISVAHPFEH